ncbi:aldo/keto reductase [Marinivivus vitaminiproducens]|uniref:aldo/keto reductase n=1 Tax=Marinivivus vitaminiproducens TaxID=3035935 RepID=UPI0027AAB76C|nr:aldo/keto reductase [Geminicoccaceae bacterium SCSIO 64248]
MEERQIGRSDLWTAPLVFGGNVFGWTADEPTSHRLLDHFVDTGFNAVDTADVYSKWVDGNHGGESETIIGNWVAKGGKRDRILLLTKVGMEMGDGGKGLARDYIVRSVENSLRRLQTDYVDLYQSHADDPDVSIDEPLEAYERLIKEGKVRFIGASNFTAERLGSALDASEAKGLPRYESLQPHYNLYERADFEAALAGLCRERQLGVITYFSLASGFLTGKYRSEADLGKSRRGDRVKGFLDDRGKRILAALDSVAADTGAKPAQIALAWLIAQPSVTAPIVSATSTAQWDEIAKAATLTLDDRAVKTLTDASAP